MEDLLSKQYFETVSADWDEMGAGFFGEAPRRRIYNEMNVSPGDHITDIGSGSGYLLEGLVNRGLKLTAVDQSPAMLSKIQEKLGPGVSIVEGTSEALPISDNSSDVVIANMYLHHVERPNKAIAEMVRILKKGGQLIFTDLDSHDYDELIEEQHDRWKGFERDDVRIWMEEAGLKEVIIDCVGADCCTESCNGGAIKISIFVAKGIKV